MAMAELEPWGPGSPWSTARAGGRAGPMASLEGEGAFTKCRHETSRTPASRESSSGEVPTRHPREAREAAGPGPLPASVLFGKLCGPSVDSSLLVASEGREA